MFHNQVFIFNINDNEKYYISALTKQQLVPYAYKEIEQKETS